MNDLNAVEPEIVSMRFLCVVFGLHSSPFLLGGTLQHHIKCYQPDDPAFVEKLLKSLYVDNLISSSNSVKEAFELFLKSKACQRGSVTLTPVLALECTSRTFVC